MTETGEPSATGGVAKRAGWVVCAFLMAAIGLILGWLQAEYTLEGLRSGHLVERPARLLEPIRVTAEDSPWLPDYRIGEIHARYAVTHEDGHTTEHDRVWLHQPRQDDVEGARAEAADLEAADLEAAGAGLTAWIDPRDPEFVVLLNHVNWRDNLLALLIPTSFLVAAGLALWRGLGRRGE